MNKQIEELCEKTLREIFPSGFNKFEPMERTKIIYNYIVNNFTYDNDLLEKRKQKHMIDLFDECIFLFEKKYGICSTIPEIYKLMLEKIGVKSETVICDDNSEVFHKLNIILDEEKNTWFFSDATRGIFAEKKDDDFAYGSERVKTINQKIKGEFPAALYDFILKGEQNQTVKKKNELGLFILPENIYEGFNYNSKEKLK